MRTPHFLILFALLATSAAHAESGCRADFYRVEDNVLMGTWELFLMGPIGVAEIIPPGGGSELIVMESDFQGIVVAPSGKIGMKDEEDNWISVKVFRRHGAVDKNYPLGPIIDPKSSPDEFLGELRMRGLGTKEKTVDRYRIRLVCR